MRPINHSLTLLLLALCMTASLTAGELGVGAVLDQNFDDLIETDAAFTGPVDYGNSLVFRDYGPYAIWLSPDTLCSAVSVEWLIEHTFDNVGGSISFTEDDQLPLNLQVDSDMYLQADTPNHGEFDRGHMTPRFDMDSEADERLSYFTTNICPQLSTLNGGNWRALESQVRDTTINQPANSDDRTLVLTGPIFTNAINVRIPTNSQNFSPTVAVPDGFFKIACYCGQDFVVDAVEVSVWMQISAKPASYYEDTTITTIRQIESLTGLLFRDVGTPTLSSYSPSPMPLSGGTVTLSGSSLDDATSVLLDGSPLSYTVSGDTLIVDVPAGQSGMTVTIAVVSPFGTTQLQAMYETGVMVPPPMIDDVQPREVSVSGGQVRVTGMALDTVTSVSVNSRAASYTIDQLDLLVEVPAGASGRAISLGVSSAGGADVFSLAYETLAPRPVVRTLTPSLIPAAGGEVRLSGDNLALVERVEYDSSDLTFRKQGLDLLVTMPARGTSANAGVKLVTMDISVTVNLRYADPGQVVPNPTATSSNEDDGGCALGLRASKPLVFIVLIFIAAAWLRRRRLGSTKGE